MLNLLTRQQLQGAVLKIGECKKVIYFTTPQKQPVKQVNILTGTQRLRMQELANVFRTPKSAQMFEVFPSVVL